jgi:fatty-acid peroxygenase
MPPIPRDKSLGSAMALLSDGYTLISKRRHRYQFDIFETRLMLRKVVCATGEGAAKMFYCLDVIANTHTRSTVNFR